MSLETGEQIGPYEILAPLARGGMGEVYRARDNRLSREVALKMLPDAAAHDADSLARFDRETRAVAALNHPNIMAIHDTGSFRAIPWAVTELLQGESLADRLRSGPIAPEKAVDIAAQIADGLAAAHLRGIIHRDIKPDNIFLTNEGRAKILDFGIARIEQPARTPGIAGPRSTHTSSQFLVGTAGYMSPEQVRGKPIDARTDIFSLGATFYEMITGRRAFARETPVETLGAVLRDDPTTHPETEKIPDGLRAFVFRALEKDPADRYQSARDLLMDLRAWQAERISGAAARVQFRTEPPWKHRRTRVMYRAVGGVVLFILGLWAGSCWERDRRGALPRTAPSASSRP
jgi:eukaryotic-like serine/threonine-protein kinase